MSRTQNIKKVTTDTVAKVNSLIKTWENSLKEANYQRPNDLTTISNDAQQCAPRYYGPIKK